MPAGPAEDGPRAAGSVLAFTPALVLRGCPGSWRRVTWTPLFRCCRPKSIISILRPLYVPEVAARVTACASGFVARRDSVTSQCIYPGPHDDMSEEHYLPVSLGRFRGCEPLRDRACRGCNKSIGDRLEFQFARAGPTGLFRWILGIKGRTGLPPSPF